MSKVYEVTSSTLEETVDFGDGKMDKYSLSLKDTENEAILENVAQWCKQGRVGFLQGVTIEADIKNQPRGGLKLANATEVAAGSTPSPNGGSSTPSGGGGRKDATGRSIERQVALKGAVEFAAASVAAGRDDITPGKVVAVAAIFDSFLNVDSDKSADDEIPW